MSHWTPEDDAGKSPRQILTEQLLEAAEWMSDTTLYERGERFPEWPWQVFRDAYGPIVPGTCTYICAFPSNGKTSFVSHLVRSLLEQGHKTAVFPLEADYKDFLGRLMCTEYGMEADDVLKKAMRVRAMAGDEVAAQNLDLLTMAFRRRVIDIGNGHAWSNLSVDRLDELTTSDFWSRLAYYAARGVRVVVVDHVDHVEPGYERAAIAASDELQRMALRASKMYGMAMILCTQLNSSKVNGDRLYQYRRPVLPWLYNKSQKEQIGRLMIGLFRPVDPNVEPDMLRAAEKGDVDAKEIAWPHRMGIATMKGRYEGGSAHRTLTLAYDGRTLTDVTLPGVMAERGKVAGTITPAALRAG